LVFPRYKEVCGVNVRIRLYIENRGEDPGLYYGSGRKKICDNKWQITIKSSEKYPTPSPIWRHIYQHDLAQASDGWYTLDINKFAMIT
jgi:hypothetical protein